MMECTYLGYRLAIVKAPPLCKRIHERILLTQAIWADLRFFFNLQIGFKCTFQGHIYWVEQNIVVSTLIDHVRPSQVRSQNRVEVCSLLSWVFIFIF